MFQAVNYHLVSKDLLILGFPPQGHLYRILDTRAQTRVQFFANAHPKTLDGGILMTRCSCVNYLWFTKPRRRPSLIPGPEKKLSHCGGAVLDWLTPKGTGKIKTERNGMVIKAAPIQSMTGAFSIKGISVIVTGGNRGIGLGISAAYAQSGANVAILCRNKETGDKAAEKLRQYGTACLCVACEVDKAESVRVAVAEVYQQFGRVEVLVNNAGVSTTREFINDKDLSDWHRVMDTNLHGPAHTIYEVAPRMIKAGKGGTIINISSIGGQSLGGARTHPMPSYHVSKAGLDMFTRNMAIELGDYGIRVNGIAPGPTHSSLDEDLPPDALEKFENLMPMHRFAEPIEIGALCVFLSSPAANHITGTVIVHDGGLLLIA
jgi:NAD(P)-dependent dehydrogenase (short-subunit alcohol dehydrogenase family)